MSKKPASKNRPKNPQRSGNPAIAAKGKSVRQHSLPSASGSKKSNATPIPPKMPWKEKLILSTTFILGSLAVYWAANTLRPAEGRANTLLSNIAFSTSGGFLAIILLILIVNGVPRPGRPKLNKKAFQKTVMIALALILGISGVLVAFGTSTPAEEEPNDDYVFGS